MKEIKILGPGCPRCEELLSRTETVAREMGLECRITKVSDINEIANYGIMMTPALVVDGQVKCIGKVPPPDEIRKMLE